MPNAIYPKYKEAVLQSSANSSLTGTVKVALVDTGAYTYSATHEFLTSLTGRVGTDPTLASKTFANGVFDAADVAWTALTGNSAEALVIYIDTGTAGTSRLVAYIDTGVTNLPVTPNGGDVNLTFNASGIFAL
jgi:sugar (pentulose or hexulose) kinase